METHPDPIGQASERREHTLAVAIAQVERDAAFLNRIAGRLTGHARHRAECALVEAEAERAALMTRIEAARAA